MVSEFDLIRRFFTHPAPGAVLGVGDDAALMKPTPGQELVVSTDMLVAGRHFFLDADPEKLGRKALAVNLSDLAAMGAQPRWTLLALALPEPDEEWVGAFARGFMDLAAQFRVDLVGGDTTHGPLNVCVTVLGEVPDGEALRRDGAKAGDDIWISGTVGDAALALAHLRRRLALDPHDAAFCLARLDTPTPRVALGMALRGIAHAAIDVSDGLAQDLGHILERSEVGAVLEFSRLPRSAVMARLADRRLAAQCMLAGGDDYELLFTAPPGVRRLIEDLGRELGLPLTPIGRITGERGFTLRGEDGAPITLERMGFDHFR
ncbi:thiamine-phosphate kinase [Pelomicrobium sp. G1]|uniref:thiamine-phosphate kinase n=1 Tax=unclassified Pelomicrobium TaxID=2815318 RepID=UPI003F775026